MRGMPHIRLLVCQAVAVATLSLAMSAQPAGAVITTKSGDHIVLNVSVTDGAPRDVASVAALVVKLNGRENQHVLATPGTGRTTYEALLGPFDGGHSESASSHPRGGPGPQTSP